MCLSNEPPQQQHKYQWILTSRTSNRAPSPTDISCRKKGGSWRLPTDQGYFRNRSQRCIIAPQPDRHCIFNRRRTFESNLHHLQAFNPMSFPIVRRKTKTPSLSCLDVIHSLLTAQYSSSQGPCLRPADPQLSMKGLCHSK